MRRMTRYSRFEQELPPIGSPTTTRDGKYGEVIAHEGAQVRLQFAGSIQGLYFPDEITVNAAVRPLSAQCPKCGTEDIGLKQTGICQECGHNDPNWVPLDEPRTAKWQTQGAELHLADFDYPELQQILAEPAPQISQSTAPGGAKRVSIWGSAQIEKKRTGLFVHCDDCGFETWTGSPDRAKEIADDHNSTQHQGSKTAGPGSSKTGASYEDLNIARDFLHDNWDDIYNVTKDRDMDGYRSVWSTTLHGPDGDKVWVGIKDDGTPVDLTKRGSKTAAHEYHCTRCGTRLVKGKYEIAPTHCLGVANGHDWEEGPVKTAATDDDAYTPPTPTTHRYELSGCVNQWLPDHDHADCWRAFMKHQGRPEGTSYSEYYASKTAAFDPNKHWCQGTGQFPKADGGCPTCFEKHPELSASGAIKAHNPTSVWDTGHSDSIPPFVR